MSDQIPYPTEHSQACFGVHGNGCVCPIGNREARVRHQAPAMEVLLRRLVAPGKTEDRRVTERRRYGWPLCPWCGEDELAAVKTIPTTPGAIDLCYRRGPVEVVD